MSKYTTEVRFICEAAAGLDKSVGFNDIDKVLDAAVEKIFNFNFPTPSTELVDKAIPNIFNFSFPCFDENYRKILCKKILLHYYTREICEETVGLWKLRLCTRLNEIMPYYNQLYRSAAIEFNPFYDVEYSRTIKRNKEEKSDKVSTTTEKTDNFTTSKQESEVYNDNVNRYSETPQGSIDNLYSDNYLTNATINTDDNKGKSNVEYESSNDKDTDFDELHNIESVEDFLESIKGKHNGQSYSSMLIEYRQTFLNIDMMVIDDLKDLFFNLW